MSTRYATTLASVMSANQKGNVTAMMTRMKSSSRKIGAMLKSEKRRIELNEVAPREHMRMILPVSRLRWNARLWF